MSLTLLIVLITAIVAGIGFWFYNRRQINSLTETLEDKNAVISSFRDHLSTTVVEESIPQTLTRVDSNVTIDTSTPIVSTQKSEKKKKRYSNRPKKNGNGNTQNPTKSEQKQKEKSTQPKPEKNGDNRGRKPKKQQ
jgi:FtsZ-interacting cell division protein ZipA